MFHGFVLLFLCFFFFFVEEKTRFSKQITQVLNESSLRVQKEIDVAKQSYNDKLNDMLIHIQRLELELGEKDLALERSIR